MFQFKDVSYGPLKDLTFSINKKEKVMLFGPSGAGKSTLLFLFNRLHSPSSGSIYLDEKEIADFEVTDLRKRVGLVLQDPNLFPGTVLDNIKYGPSIFGEWDEREAEKLLQYVQLPTSYIDRDVEQLSGGEKQRVSLARTLANSPEVLLLDEPTSALDYRTAEEIEECLENLIEEHNLTMIMVTHNLQQASRLGERGLFIVDGQLVEDGRILEMLEKPKSNELARFIEE
ncbi:phosphate ABC transporter ATP-binding protein [Halobacillus andaensis]|uniref:Phosphate ABC transporter ATP-binding protein n=1 Tax=Halobacillus andaensis TaxID=1176239 RepID=A0A917AYP2_HALAA|nr:phosphate ABC transporter ATP-binding protein [Halobacillus andaensis]MBP2003099.1 putative ABC transport system ATP-binding protein [Halobacillus andaensis]GGF07981.1 phosphate ABC transporter ATP-binding protein [Halobacillus andaensis]